MNRKPMNKLVNAYVYGITLTLLVCFAHTRQAYSQIVIDQSQSTEELLQSLFGSGIQISNLETSCNLEAIGSFNGSNSNIGLNSGVIISTGRALGAPGPNPANATNPTFVNGEPGSALLNQLVAPQLTLDACVIEFDIQPLCDSISISYVFASEEYPEYVNRNYNDVFAFFISGPGFNGDENIALVPGQNIPVSINNINDLFNQQFYINNLGGPTVAYDGFTVPLKAVAEVTPCESYHITIAIADVRDDLFDSAVFLESGGIRCSSPIPEIAIRSTGIRPDPDPWPDAQIELGATEGCSNAVISFSLSDPLTEDQVYKYQVAGTATPGLDYQALPDSVIMPAGQTLIEIPVSIIADSIEEGIEYLDLIFESYSICTGNSSSDTASLAIFDPLADISVPDTTICSNESFQVGLAPLESYLYFWEGEGNISDPFLSNPVITINSLGNQLDTSTFILTVANAFGYCWDKDTIELVSLPAVNAGFSGDFACIEENLQFSDESTGGEIASWEWNFGDGVFSDIPNPAHSYAQSGDYIVSLAVANTYACGDTVSRQIEIADIPQADFDFSGICEGATVVFADRTIADGQGPMLYAWDFDDGSNSTIQNPGHIFTSGSYEVSLIVENRLACTDTITQTVEIASEPQAQFRVEAVCEGSALDIVNESLDPDGRSLSYSWDFGNGDTSEIGSPIYIYPTPGRKSMILTVVNSAGCTDAQVVETDIYPAINADFLSDSVCEGESSILSAVVNSQGPVTVTEWRWDLGDGNLANGENVNHVYQGDGIYDVELLMVSDNNCRDSVTKQVPVLQTPEFTFTNEGYCDQQEIQFRVTSANPSQGLSYEWDFGDGVGQSTVVEAAYTFPSEGSYSIQLIGRLENGCSDTMVQELGIAPKPIADFSAEDVCEGEMMRFVNLSSIGAGSAINRYRWTLPDASTNAEANPEYESGSAGVYNVELMVESNAGCRDTVSNQISVFALPVPEFTVEDVCEGQEAIFMDVSAAAGVGIAEWRWDLGNGEQITGQSNLNYLYPQAGVYQVSLELTSQQGCQGISIGNMEVFDSPPDPIILTDTLCEGEDVVILADLPRGTEDVGVLWYENENDLVEFQEGFALILPELRMDQTYYLASRSENGCVSERVEAKVVVKAADEVQLLVSDSTLEIPNALLRLEVEGLGGDADISWDMGDGTEEVGFSVIHFYESPGLYTVEFSASDQYDCEYYLTQNIEVIKPVRLVVPNAFSPNGDGMNDEFYVGHYLVAAFKVKIFDRWGKGVYESEDRDFRWNGTGMDGTPLPEGVYTFRIVALDITGEKLEDVGTITLLR